MFMANYTTRAGLGLPLIHNFLICEKYLLSTYLFGVHVPPFLLVTRIYYLSRGLGDLL